MTCKGKNCTSDGKTPHSSECRFEYAANVASGVKGFTMPSRTTDHIATLERMTSPGQDGWLLDDERQAITAAIALMRGQSDMVLVPRISTETMRNVAIARYQEFADDNGPYTREGERQQMQAVWSAMIGAAPKVPSPPKDTADEQ